MGFKEKLESGEKVITVELSPPKGTNVAGLLEVAEALKGKVDAINITDNQRAIMHMNSLAACALLKAQGHEPVMQICCRDRNRIALQSDLLGAHALGIRNVCVMTGDHPILGDHPSAKPVFDLDSIQLLELIGYLGTGVDFMGNELNGGISFNVGSVFNPYAEPLELQLMKLRKKIDAGAKFIQTQPVFDVGTAEVLMKYEGESGVPFLLGITPLRSLRMARFMGEKVLRKPLPESIIKRLETAADAEEEGLRMAEEFVYCVKGLAKGIHVMPVGGDSNLTKFISRLNFS